MKDEAFLVYGNGAKVSGFYQNPGCNRNRKYTFTKICNNLLCAHVCRMNGTKPKSVDIA